MNLSAFEILDIFYANADPVQAESMVAYRKDVCPFLGIPKPKRAALSKDFLNWEFVDKCWTLEREFQYLALEYPRTVAPLLTVDDLPKFCKLAVTKSWWDMEDCLDRTVGGIAQEFPAADNTLLAWSTEENI
jgi:3-methyladenine DNA glycosylase AlkD